MVTNTLLKTERRVNAKTRGKTVKVVREQYLRDDVCCHSPLCELGCLEAPGKKTFPLPKDATHYVIPCFDVILKYLEVLEIPDFTGIIFLQSIVTMVLRDVGKRHYERILSMSRDIRCGCVVFLNEIHKSTSVMRHHGQSYMDWLTKSTYNAAIWYSTHLKGNIPIVIVTEDETIIAEFSKCSSDVVVMTFKCYLEKFWNDVKFAQELYDSISSSSDDPDTDNTKSYMQYLPTECLENGIKTGHFLSGRLLVNKHRAGEEAFVRCSMVSGKKIGDILIYGMIDRNRAIHGDEVVVQLLPKSEWRTRSHFSSAHTEEDRMLKRGKVVGILQRRWRDFVATLPAEEDTITTGKNGRDRVLVIPYDYRIPKIRIVTKQVKRLQNDRIVVRIDSWNVDSNYPNGHFVKSLGQIGELDTEVAAMLVEHGLSMLPVSNKVLTELTAVSGENAWTIDENEIEKRADLRKSHLVFSIDPDGCEDVDDALSIRHFDDGCLELGVHIADVTHFVKPSSAIDLEAQAKSTSVYLPDRRYDMLPSFLSADLCSLCGGKDRYAVSVIWKFYSNYEIKEVWYGRSIICSRYKMTYEAAQKILDGKSSENAKELVPEFQNLSSMELNESYLELKHSLHTLVKITHAIREKRLENGGVELDTAKPNFEFDTANPCTIGRVKPQMALEIHKVVAECMIFANHWVAKKIASAFPTKSLLRKHPSPRKEDLKELNILAKVKGFTFDADGSRGLRIFLDHIVDPNDPSINEIFRFLATCAMYQASYISTGSCSPDDWYHYGLGLNEYTHFTSPIRRYADILVHRLLLAAVDTEEATYLYPDNELKHLCEHINEKHTAARHVQKVSTELYQSFYFQSISVDDEQCVVDAVIYSLQENGVMVYVPSYALKGPVYLLSKDNQVVVISDNGMKWVEGKLVRTDLEISVETNFCQQKYRLLDHITVRIKIQPSRTHLPGIAFDLIANKPHTSQLQFPFSSSKEVRPEIAEDSSDVFVKTKLQQSYSKGSSDMGKRDNCKQPSLYEILKSLKELTVRPKEKLSSLNTALDCRNMCGLQ